MTGGTGVLAEKTDATIDDYGYILSVISAGRQPASIKRSRYWRDNVMAINEIDDILEIKPDHHGM